MKKRQAKEQVVQAYWNADQRYKQAESARGSARDLALIVLRMGETCGPVWDDEDVAHWLTHGKKETVEINPYYLAEILADPLEFCKVDTALLKAQMPKVYAKLLKHKATTRRTHSCLTWSTKPKRARR